MLSSYRVAGPKDRRPLTMGDASGIDWESSLPTRVSYWNFLGNLKAVAYRRSCASLSAPRLFPTANARKQLGLQPVLCKVSSISLQYP